MKALTREEATERLARCGGLEVIDTVKSVFGLDGVQVRARFADGEYRWREGTTVPAQPAPPKSCEVTKRCFPVCPGCER